MTILQADRTGSAKLILMSITKTTWVNYMKLHQNQMLPNDNDKLTLTIFFTATLIVIHVLIFIFEKAKGSYSLRK